MSNQVSFKHNEGEHDQREHGNWSKGPGMYGGEVYVPTGRRTDFLNNRAGMSGNAFSNIAQSQTLFSSIQQNPANYIVDMSNHNNPILSNNGNLYQWRVHPDATQGLIDSNDTWFAYDGYILPIVAHDLAKSLGLNQVPEAAHSSLFNSVIVADFPDKTSSAYVSSQDDVKRTTFPRQALLDIIIGQGDGSFDNYRAIKGELPAISYEKSGKRDIQSVALESLIKPSSQHSNSTNYYDKSRQRFRLSPEMFNVLLNARKNIQWSAEVPEGVREQIQERMDNIIRQSVPKIPRKKIEGSDINFVDLDNLNTTSFNLRNSPVSPGMIALQKIKRKYQPMITQIEQLKSRKKTIDDSIDLKLLEEEYPGFSETINSLRNMLSRNVAEVNSIMRGLMASELTPNANSMAIYPSMPVNINALNNQINNANEFSNQLESILNIAYSKIYFKEQLENTEKNLKLNKQNMNSQGYNARINHLNQLKENYNMMSNDLYGILHNAQNYINYPQYRADLEQVTQFMNEFDNEIRTLSGSF